MVRSHFFITIVTVDLMSPPFLYSSVGSLTSVLLVTMGRETYDDYKRNLHDREANSVH